MSTHTRLLVATVLATLAPSPALAQEPAQVSFESNDAELATLYRVRAPSRETPIDEIPDRAMHLLCQAPCSLVLEPGPHLFGFGSGDARPTQFRDVLATPGAHRLSIERVDRTDLQIAGLLTILIGIVGAGLFGLLATIDSQEASGMGVVLAGISGTVAATVGPTLLALPSRTRIRFE